MLLTAKEKLVGGANLMQHKTLMCFGSDWRRSTQMQNRLTLTQTENWSWGLVSQKRKVRSDAPAATRGSPLPLPVGSSGFPTTRHTLFSGTRGSSSPRPLPECPTASPGSDSSSSPPPPPSSRLACHRVSRLPSTRTSQVHRGLEPAGLWHRGTTCSQRSPSRRPNRRLWFVQSRLSGCCRPLLTSSVSHWRRTWWCPPGGDVFSGWAWSSSWQHEPWWAAGCENLRMASHPTACRGPQCPGWAGGAPG